MNASVTEWPVHPSAHVVADHMAEQGWELLDDGTIVFEDTGEISWGGEVVGPHRPEPAHAARTNTPCVETENARNAKGYGKCGASRFGRTINFTHVRAWVDYHGRLPAAGMQINHHCDNPPCQNTEHLYEGTHAQNMRDMAERGRSSNCRAAQLNRAKTHCPQGHEYTPENTYFWQGENRHARQCRICRREHDRTRTTRRNKAATAGAGWQVVA